MPPMLGLKKPDPVKLRASLQASSYIDVSKIAVPETVDWSAKVRNYGLYRNNEIGICGPTGCANMIRQWSANDGQQIDLSQASVEQCYRDVGGWNGRDIGRGTDGGVDPIALMNYWRNVGIGGHKIDAWLAIDPNDTKLVDACLYLFGSLAIGFNMPTVWQDTIGQVWRGPRDPSRPPRGYEPGSWGGHFVIGSKAEKEDWEVATWAALQKVSGTGFRAYCMFLAVAISKDWTGLDGVAPNGFNADLLSRDLQHIEQGKPLDERPSEKEKPTNLYRTAANAVTTVLGGKVERVNDSEDRIKW